MRCATRLVHHLLVLRGILSASSIHKRVYRLCRHGDGDGGKGSAGHRWPIFQSGREAIGRQLGAAEARTAGCTDLAGVVICNEHPVSMGTVTEYMYRAAEQSEGGKSVGVDPSVITARTSTYPQFCGEHQLSHDSRSPEAR